MPIASAMFPSNWELSAVRASSVVRLFVEGGVRPSRLTAAGYGDQRPVADNATRRGGPATGGSRSSSSRAWSSRR
jgi:chemotaxis protein MotB